MNSLKTWRKINLAPPTSSLFISSMKLWLWRSSTQANLKTLSDISGASSSSKSATALTTSFTLSSSSSTSQWKSMSWTKITWSSVHSTTSMTHGNCWRSFNTLLILLWIPDRWKNSSSYLWRKVNSFTKATTQQTKSSRAIIWRTSHPKRRRKISCKKFSTPQNTCSKPKSSLSTSSMQPSWPCSATLPLPWPNTFLPLANEMWGPSVLSLAIWSKRKWSKSFPSLSWAGEYLSFCCWQSSSNFLLKFSSNSTQTCLSKIKWILRLMWPTINKASSTLCGRAQKPSRRRKFLCRLSMRKRAGMFMKKLKVRCKKVKGLSRNFKWLPILMKVLPVNIRLKIRTTKRRKKKIEKILWKNLKKSLFSTLKKKENWLWQEKTRKEAECCFYLQEVIFTPIRTPFIARCPSIK